MLPCALLPRQARGTLNKQFTKPTVQGILSLGKSGRVSAGKSQIIALLDRLNLVRGVREGGGEERGEWELERGVEVCLKGQMHRCSEVVRTETNPFFMVLTLPYQVTSDADVENGMRRRKEYLFSRYNMLFTH